MKADGRTRFSAQEKEMQRAVEGLEHRRKEDKGQRKFFIIGERKAEVRGRFRARATGRQRAEEGL